MVISKAIMEQLQRTVDLSAEQLQRLISELVVLLSEDQESFVCRRHAELQGQLHGDELWLQLAAELRASLFLGNEYTLRQLRRMVYRS